MSSSGPRRFSSFSDDNPEPATNWAKVKEHVVQGNLLKPPFADLSPELQAKRQKQEQEQRWWDLVAMMSPQLLPKLTARADRGDDDANAKNARQALLAIQKGTIWNAVVYANTKEGQQSWALATRARSEDEGSEREGWTTGEVRGVMGETPLHAAVLCCNSRFHEEVVHKLWDGYPELRTAVYLEELYRGENVLHIAIVRKLKRSIIEKFVESEEGATLMEQRADGLFFKRAELSDGCCNYGEYPLAFAACTNQRDVFDYLVSQGAQLKFQTDEGYNLLHLMVLHSFHQHSLEGEGGVSNIMFGTDNSGSENDEWCRDMYDHIQDWMEKKGCYREMSQQKDYLFHTPLSLAACKGSLQMFNHLFNKLMSVEWSFGPVTCRKLYLQGVDVPLDDEVGSQHRHARSVLEVVVESERLDILTEGYLKKILDAKWSKYASRMFRKRFWWAVALACNLMFVSSINTGGSLLYEGMIILAEMFLAGMYLRECVREVVRLAVHGLDAYLNTNRAHVFERVFALTTTPICCTIVFLRWYNCKEYFLTPWLRPLLALLQGNSTAAAEAQSSLPPLEDFDPIAIQIPKSCRQAFDSWALKAVSKTLHLIQSVLCFLNLFRGMMGFPEYGHFVLMLIQMLQHDMRKFCAIYAIFLFGFAQLLYVSCDLTNTGMPAFLLAMRTIFQAALNQVDLDMENGKNPVTDLSVGTKQLVFSIILCNFFLVSLVLVNLLIAMMSSTYEDINSAAKRQWNLVRARIITNLDKEMSVRERGNSANTYWECETNLQERFMTFTSSELLDEYLQGKVVPQIDEHEVLPD